MTTELPFAALPPPEPPGDPHDIRPECVERFRDVDKKLAMGHERFVALDRRIKDRGEATDRRIDDTRDSLREEVRGVEKRTREDIKELERKGETRHRETIDAIQSIPTGATPAATVPPANGDSLWRRLPGFMRVLIVIGVILGSAVVTVVGAIAGFGGV